MSLSDLASLGTFVSSIAVLVSLVFLYFQLRQLNAQVRQAEVNQQALVKQARTDRVLDINGRMSEESFANLNLRITQNAPDLKIAEMLRYAAHARMVFQNGEESYAQYLRGLLTQTDFISFSSAMRWGFQSPALRVAWRSHRSMFRPPYVDFVDGLVSEAQVVLLTAQSLTRWKADMAGEIAQAEATAPEDAPVPTDEVEAPPPPSAARP